MRILMVSPYPPVRDGIAAYGLQAVARLRAEGHEVEVLSPGPSAAHHHLDLCGPRGALALARRVRGYDKVIVQFHPDVFFPVPCRPRDRTAIAVALTAAFRAAHDLEVRVHETDYALGRGPAPSAAAIRAMWRSVPRVVVHTEEERSSFHSAFGVPLSRITVAHHGEDFVARALPDRAAARARLDIPSEVVMFLSIGFIQPHKGFDRAVRAFSGLGGRGCRLDVVGSVRVEEPEYLRYLEELEDLAGRTPGAHVHAGYVSDEAFDRWIVASDVVVLPYRHIWSSGVMERAALYDRPVVATRVGGLAAQARPGTVVVDDDEELAATLWRLADERLPQDAPRPASQPWPQEEASREAVQAEIRARAAYHRGGVLDRLPGGAGASRPASRSASRAAPRSASAPLRRLPLLAPPAPASNRFGAGMLKRVVRRLTAWEIDPLVAQINQLQAAATEVADGLARPARGSD